MDLIYEGVLPAPKGKIIEEITGDGKESGIALGGGGNMSTLHVINFFDTIRGKAKANAPIDDANISMAMVHYANVSSRIGENFHIDKNKGSMLNTNAINYWGKDYEESWKNKFLNI